MPSLKIARYPSNQLSNPTASVNLFDQLVEAEREMSELMSTMPRAAAIAANQVIGKPWNSSAFFFVRKDIADEAEIPQTIVNPTIAVSFGPENDWIREEEGCLSFPGVKLDISRPNIVIADFQDINGDRHKAELKGFVSRVFQHEIEHLQGRTFLQMVNYEMAQRIRRQMAKAKGGF